MIKFMNSTQCFNTILLLSLVEFSYANGIPVRDLREMSLEDLLNVEITSLEKHGTPLQTAPASVYVISGSDIRRSGASSLADVLRLAPNLQVARINSQEYAISARGFLSNTSNKLQVLIDGRIVYTPLYSGVFWDAQDLIIDDIERVEVISGPADAVWGGNAVNGVINVITRQSKTVLNTLVNVASGTDGEHLAIRNGLNLSKGLYLKSFIKLAEIDQSEDLNGIELVDKGNRQHIGLHLINEFKKNSLSMQGEYYSGEIGNPRGTREISGYHFLIDWENRAKDRSTINLISYLDVTERQYPQVFSERLTTFYFELRHALSFDRSALTWGADFRYADDAIVNSPSVAFLPEDKTMQWTGLFIQNRLALSGTTELNLSARVEENPFSGVEFMPTLRLAWVLGNESTVWTAISRANRTPSRIDTEFYSPSEPPYTIVGENSFKSETSDSFQIGYRSQLFKSVSVDTTLFYHKYDHLRSLEPVGDGSFAIRNGLQANTIGIEGWSTLKVGQVCNLELGFLAVKEDFTARPGVESAVSREGNSPKTQIHMKASFDLSDKAELDFIIRHTSKKPAPEIADNTYMNIRFAWWGDPNTEWSFLASNLSDGRFTEFGSEMNRVYFSPEVKLELRWIPM